MAKLRTTIENYLASIITTTSLLQQTIAADARLKVNESIDWTVLDDIDTQLGDLEDEIAEVNRQ
jgi:hypothetical protein